MGAIWAGLKSALPILSKAVTALAPFIKRIKAVRAAGANPESIPQDQADAMLDNALRLLGRTSHTDPMWEKLAAELAAILVRPEHFTKPYVRAWLSTPATAGSLKVLTRSSLASGPANEHHREKLIESYMEVSGDNRQLAEDSIKIAVAFLKTSIEISAKDSGNAAILQAGLQTVHEELTKIKHSLDDTNLKHSPPPSSDGATLSDIELRKLARTLLNCGEPPSLKALYLDASPAALTALATASSISRMMIETTSKMIMSPKRCTLRSVISGPTQKNIIIAPPGSGKTHALWHIADQLLSAGETIPLYLPAGRLNNWEQVLECISEISPDISPELIIRDPRIYIFIDGWSEFALGEYAPEKAKALRILSDCRVIASARYIDVGDSRFTAWELEPLPPTLVATTIKSGCKRPLPAESKMLELLRLPLMLSLFVLSDREVSETGELLRLFHERMMLNIREDFSDVLAVAVAKSTIAGDRSYRRLVMELKAEADRQGISNSNRLLENLGTIANRSGQAIPVHDLYWSWLCGCGLLMMPLRKEVIKGLDTRESLGLALDSGQLVKPGYAQEVAPKDILLAARLDSHNGTRDSYSFLSAEFEKGLADNRLSVSNRFALASAVRLRPEYFKQTLDIFSRLRSSGLWHPGWSQTLRVDDLYVNRGPLAEWLGSPGTEQILEVIATHGGPEWLNWLEWMASAEKITFADATAVGLACSSAIPAWSSSHLDDLVSTVPWKLRWTATRRSNIALALEIAVNYNRLIEVVIKKSSSAWLELNRALVGCGDDTVFTHLLSQFECMSPKSQELLGYAIVDFGADWVVQFQKIAFSEPGKHHNKLEEVISDEIDDETARRWIAAGHDKIGWRILVARHGNALLPELMAKLPNSFSGHEEIRPLIYMGFLEAAPESLIDEIWRRVNGQMQPKTMYDALTVLSKIVPLGMVSIIKFIIRTPSSLPAYHLDYALKLHKKWRTQTGLDIKIRTPEEEASFDYWIAAYTVRNNWEDHFSATLLSATPQLAIKLVLSDYRNDVKKIAQILEKQKSMKAYDSKLFELMLESTELSALIPTVFAESFDTFPAESLRRLLDCAEIDQSSLLYRISTASDPLHRSIHIVLINRILSQPIKIEQYCYVASMLKAYPRYELIEILKESTNPEDDNSMWFIRQVETARNEMLIEENGNFF